MEAESDTQYFHEPLQDTDAAFEYLKVTGSG
jgi:hypothetical protein